MLYYGETYTEAIGNGATETQAHLAAAKTSIPSALLEGMEGGLQGIIGQAAKKSTYQKNLPMFSMTEEAVINPKQIAQGFLFEGLAGGIMGGTMDLGGKAVNLPRKLLAGNAKTAAEVKAEIASKIQKAEIYKKEIDGVFDGTLPEGKDIIIGETPEILQHYGAKPLDLHISQNVIRKIAYPEGYLKGKHNLGISAIKHLPEQLENPVAIIRNPQKNKKGLDSLIVLTEWNDIDNKPVIAVIHLSSNGAIGLQNNVATTFGADYIGRLVGTNEENILYTKNGENVHQLLSQGRLLPMAMADDVFTTSSIYKKNTNVKYGEGIKKEETLVGGHPGVNPTLSGDSSVSSSTQTIPQSGDGVNTNDTQVSTNGGVDVGEVSQTVDAMCVKLGGTETEKQLLHTKQLFEKALRETGKAGKRGIRQAAMRRQILKK